MRKCFYFIPMCYSSFRWLIDDIETAISSLFDWIDTHAPSSKGRPVGLKKVRASYMAEVLEEETLVPHNRCKFLCII